MELPIRRALHQVVAHLARPPGRLPQAQVALPLDLVLLHGVVFMLGDGIPPQFPGGGTGHIAHNVAIAQVLHRVIANPFALDGLDDLHAGAGRFDAARDRCGLHLS